MHLFAIKANISTTSVRYRGPVKRSDFGAAVSLRAVTHGVSSRKMMEKDLKKSLEGGSSVKISVAKRFCSWVL